jgi:hypothetical protein
LSAENFQEESGLGSAGFHYSLAMLVWLGCSVAVTLLLPETKRRDKLWLAWLGCRAMLPLGVVALFTHFGMTIHESSYPTVVVRHAGASADETTSGALVLESSESLLIWSASQ